MHICLKIILPSIQLEQLYRVEEEETKDRHDYRQKNDIFIQDVAEHIEAQENMIMTFIEAWWACTGADGDGYSIFSLKP
ncbi:MAG: hypothetical protein NTZ24_07995 [Deltaproteobacteria bacterium]|nr:hypothetical protein [Deltaproteobacteria bacterium]